MPYILVEDFKGGLDTRRTNVTSVPGSLVTLKNAHLTRGGEIEKRKAFVQLATLPVDGSNNPVTKGLAAAGGQIYVFGSAASTDVTFATGTPTNINYVQLKHPENEARFTVTGGTDGVSTVSNITVQATAANAVNILNSTITYTTDNATTADLIATQINAEETYDTTVSPTVPEFTATADGADVIVRSAVDVGETFTITASGITFTNTDSFKSIEMTELLGTDFFNGKVYAAARFADGKIYHYWEGQNDATVTPPNRIADWFDGRARSRFNITGGTAGGTAATGTITITAGTDNPGDNIRIVRVNGVQINTNTIAHTGSNATTATAVAADINSTTSAPNYTATVGTGANTNVITITASSVGVANNGFVVAVETDGAAAASTSNLAGGVNNAITNITVDGVQIMETYVTWETSNTFTAAKVARAINEFSSAPEVEATSNGSIVNVIAKASGTALNGKTVAVTATGTVTFDQYGVSVMGGGVADTDVGGFTPGGFVKTIKSKMHSLSGSIWHQSEIDDPKQWNDFSGAFDNSDPNNIIITAGACGAIDLTNQASRSEDLKAIANYFNNLAIFAEQTIQIWFSDPNPDLAQQVQVLSNTGAIAPNSVTEFGDSDVFYLDISGIRSLKARDSSNAAFIDDIGSPIDSTIEAEIIADETAARNAAAILSPRDGRYLLAIGQKVYVFSYYPSSKISAWSVYEPGFTVQNWAYDGEQLLCRGDDNKLYNLGGSDNNTYDSSEVVVQLPFLDGGKPATHKDFYGIDATLVNDWSISLATDPTDITIQEDAGVLNKTTYGMGRAAITGYSTHIAIKLTCTAAGAAKIGNLAVHYTSSEAG